MPHTRLPVLVAGVTAACALALSVLPAYGTGADGLLDNGGFEEPNIAAGSFALFSAIPGWQPTNGCLVEIQDHTPDGLPHSGDQFVELDSNCSGGIRQAFATEPGLGYLTRYWYSPRTARISDAGAAYNNLLEVRWDGVVVQTQQRANTTLQTKWTEHATVQVAEGTVSTLAFTDGATDPRGLNDTLGVYVDTVSVVPQYTLCRLYDAEAGHHAGSAVPIRLQLCDTEGDNLSDPGLVVTATGLTNLSTGETAAPKAAGKANPDGIFRYDASLAGYVFNLKTSGLSAGTWELAFTVTGSDGVAYTTGFVVD